MKKDRNDYSHKSHRRNIIMVPGLTCSQGTYLPFLDRLNQNDDFNLIKTENYPEKIKAILNGHSMKDSAKLFGETIQNVEGELDIIGHSFGGIIGMLAELISREKGIKLDIGKVVTLSTLFGSEAIPDIWPVNKYYKSMQDIHPESKVMQAIQKEGRVDHRFVTLQDEICTMEEMDFHKGEEHKVDGGHMIYMFGDEKTRYDTADRVRKVLLAT